MELKSSEKAFTVSEKLAIKYHDIFDYPLTSEELFKWSKNSTLRKTKKYFYLKGRKKIVAKRQLNEKYSKKKFIIAKTASLLLSKIPTVMFVGITGSLAMNNAKKESDIDLMIITKNNYLWTTRFLVYFLLLVTGFRLRSPKRSDEKDKLCINLWLDENDLSWSKNDRNIYTAHEIAQVISLVNKNQTHEKFLYSNGWLLKYWPNSVKIKKLKIINKKNKRTFFEDILFKLQYFYMRQRKTREVAMATKAAFHPNDWGLKVLSVLRRDAV